MKNKSSELTVSTPGRVCLFGEHQDYLNLPIIASAISLRISMAGFKRDDATVCIHLPDIGSEESFPFHDPISYDKERDYFKSSVIVLKRHGYSFSSGMDCVVKSKIPINAGTSSSSALIVTWINFLTRMSDQSKNLSAEQIAEYAYEAEVLEFAEPGGMMDHYSTSVGGIIFLDSYPEIQLTKIKAKLGAFVLGNSGEPKDTKLILAGVKNQIQKVVKELQKSHPEFSLRTISEDAIGNYAKELTVEQIELLHGTIKNRDITMQAKEAFNKTTLDHRWVGILMNDHQGVLRETLKISTPKIDRMIGAALRAGAFGAKINGSGGGGCMFAYAPESPQQVKQAIEKEGGEGYIVTVDEGTHSSVTEVA